MNDQKGGQRRRADGARDRNRSARPLKAVAGQDRTAAHGRELTVTIPDRPLEIVTFPVTAVRHVLAGRNTGLPVYVGLGVLAVADVIDPPLAAVTGLGYAILRRWGPLRPGGGADGRKAGSSSGNREKS